MYLLALGALCFILGYTAANMKKKKEIIEIEASLDQLKCERDSLIEAYRVEKLVLAEQVDSLKAVNAGRRKLIEDYRRKISEPLPANAKELEKQIYELLKMIRGEVLPDERGVPRK